MDPIDQATATQLENVQKRTGKSLEELYGMLRASGLSKHGEMRDLFKRDLGMGHGDANAVVHAYRNARQDAPAPAANEVVDAIYSGPKAPLRPIHDAFMAALEPFGPFEIAPKKSYLSLRRRKQFAMVGPASKGRVEVGLNMRDVAPTDRLVAQPPGGMCQYKVYLSDASEVDAELLGWAKRAYEAAG